MDNLNVWLEEVIAERLKTEKAKSDLHEIINEIFPKILWMPIDNFGSGHRDSLDSSSDRYSEEAEVRNVELMEDEIAL